MLDEHDVRTKVGAAENWRDAWKIGLELADHPDGPSDALALEAFERATRLGLNVFADENAFVAMKRREARIRFLRGDYQGASNAFVFWESNSKDGLPLWAKLFRCAAVLQQGYGPGFYAKSPAMLFDALDAVLESDAENIARRDAIVETAFSKWTESFAPGKFAGDAAIPLERALRYGLGNEKHLRAFRDAFAPEFELPEPPPAIDPEIARLTEDLVAARAEIGKAQSEIKTLKERNRRQAATNRDWSSLNVELDRQARDLRTRNRLLLDQIESLRDQIETLRKNPVKKQGPTDRETELQGQIENLKQALEQAEKEAETWSDESVKSEARANKAERELAKKDAEINRLQGSILGLESRNNELVRLLERAKSEKPSAETVAETDETADKDGLRALVEKVLGGKRILVIGGFTQLDSLYRTIGESGFRKTDFRWEVDYEKLGSKEIDPFSSAYCGIIYGPAPHSMPGKGDANSLLDAIKKRPGHPFVAESRNAARQLDGSTNSFRNALGQVWTYLVGGMT